tara:strand:+ start:483 stop:668 length:186 start_codon:yes stop_codon:yes gene_type:complete
MDINLLLKLIVEEFKFILDWITLNKVYHASIYNLPITKLSIDELQKKNVGLNIKHLLFLIV